MADTQHVLVAGAGHAAGQLAISLRQGGFAGALTLVGEEAHLPYQRPPLSKKYLAGELGTDRLWLKPAEYYAENDITVRTATRVTAVDPAAFTATTNQGDSLTWDRLVIATGTRPRPLPVPGVDLDGVHYLRGASDVDAMREGFRGGRRLVIVGGGYIGLEVAAVAVGLGLDVTVVERMPRLLSRVVSPTVSDFYAGVHREAGVSLMLDAEVTALTGDAGAVRGVALADGTELPADLVLIGIGVLPNTELAAAAGIDCSDGIDTDPQGRTSVEHVFAIGDCANHPNPVVGRRVRLESVPNALGQARAAAATLLGEDKPYAEVPWFWSDQYDLKLQIVGLTQGYDECVMRGDPRARAFSCFYLREGRLIAVDAINSPREFMRAKSLVARAAVVDPAQLADPDVDLKTFD